MKSSDKKSKNKSEKSCMHIWDIVSIVSLLVFLSLMIKIILDKNGPRAFPLDVSLNIFSESIRQPSLNMIMIFITNIASLSTLAILSTILLIIFFKKQKKYSWMLLLGMIGGVILELLFKNIVQRTRPISIVELSGYSFPSGHAMMSMIFFGLLIISFKDQIKNKIGRFFLVYGSITLILLIGYSRIYLGAHWLSDVSGGYCIGLFWIWAVKSFVDKLDFTKSEIKTRSRKNKTL